MQISFFCAKIIKFNGMWRNGRRSRLKICRGQLHVGSTPTIPTIQKNNIFLGGSQNPLWLLARQECIMPVGPRTKTTPTIPTTQKKIALCVAFLSKVSLGAYFFCLRDQSKTALRWRFCRDLSWKLSKLRLASKKTTF